MKKSFLAALLMFPLVLQAQNVKLPWAQSFDNDGRAIDGALYSA